MDYMTAAQAAEKWHANLRVVQRHCVNGRVPGAKKPGREWLIPADAEKPLDPRSKRGVEDGSVGGAARELPPATIVPALHIHGGDLDGAYLMCQTVEERELLNANMALFRGDATMAKTLAVGLYRSTAQTRIKLGSGLVVALSAMCLGDAYLWKKIVGELSHLSVSEGLQMEKEYVLSAIIAGLHGKKGYPQWLETGSYTALAPELFPAARWVYVSLLYTNWKEVELLAAAEPLIAECRREHSDLCEIYLRLLAASAYRDLGDDGRARRHIDEAIALAKPLGFMEPFIEYRRGLMELLDSRLTQMWREALPPVKKQMPVFFEHWTKVYNAVWGEPIAVGLTPREYEASALAARGMTTEEIAWRMGITKSSVKKYLNTAYNKLSVEQKAKLSTLVHP